MAVHKGITKSNPRTAKRIPLADRFWAKIKKGISEGDCWEWIASTNKAGYGRISEGGDLGQILLAHRVSWILANGPIPNELFVCHHCDNPPCCNPKHLFLGTVYDNIADKMAKGRHGYPADINTLVARTRWAKRTA